ncbi:small, acid-soluble spore protein, SspJ family [Bacillus mangrovi]|uniref:Small, acid-soluble spore protein, SspJ family n=1 Tax=Metabacillus mangrovi TaxID=1491830 RepID=A0A7X2S8J7_9BACI|nr:small acid-soluble spore protein SspJ [Metabacillus mangrovi]MTH55668.1 small, acid-soluble spore protein, SspJ family [Metabacillus mangrovi]
MGIFGKDKKSEQHNDGQALQSALNEAEQALQGDPLKEAVEKKKNNHR